MQENIAEPLPAGRGVPPVPPEMRADVDRLREDFRTFISDCQTLLRNAGNLSGEGAAIARQQLSKRMADAQTKLDEVRSAATDQAMRVRVSTEDYVRREPFKALAIAAGVGALLGALIARR